LSKPLGYKLTFTSARTSVSRTDAEAIEELAGNLPLHERIQKHLASEGALTPKQIADDLGVPTNHVRARLSKYKSLFVKVGKKWGAAALHQSDAQTMTF
jgi:DNA-directed RNA polymerase specialized sigma24 family protein